jgi:integrase
MRANKGGYVFSEDGGITPVTNDRIYKQFDRALKNIGISNEEKRERNLTFHAWRHFLNTLLRMSNIADSKVQKVTGHRTMKMTEHYTHFDTRQFSEIRDVQAGLLTFQEPVEAGA